MIVATDTNPWALRFDRNFNPTVDKSRLLSAQSTHATEADAWKMAAKLLREQAEMLLATSRKIEEEKL